MRAGKKMFLFSKYSLACICAVKLCLGFVVGLFKWTSVILFQSGGSEPSWVGQPGFPTTSVESQTEPVFHQLFVDWLTSCHSSPTAVLALRASWVWRERVRVSLFYAVAHGSSRSREISLSCPDQPLLNAKVTALRGCETGSGVYLLEWWVIAA